MEVLHRFESVDRHSGRAMGGIRRDNGSRGVISVVNWE